MFKSYIKIAARNLLRQKAYSVINIAGLATGMASCILVFLFIRDELSYDTFHENAANIYRVNSVLEIKGKTIRQAVTQAPLGPAMKADLPDVEFATRFLRFTKVLKYQDKIFKERLTYADADFFKMFSFPLLAGNPEQALTEKNSIIISEDMAKKYFGDDDPLGTHISIYVDEGFEDFVVSGIAARIPDNSSIKFDILVSFEKLKDFVRESYFSEWGLFSLRTFVQLNTLSNAADINKKLPLFIGKYVENSRAKYVLQPLKDIHFGYNVEAGMSESSNITHSYILAGIAILIVLIASINFMNISIAHSSIRYKEIGLRKVFGSVRFQLIKQFWFEAIFMSTLAFAMGLFFAEMLLPVFNSTTGKSLSIDYVGNWSSVAGVLSLILIVGLLSGTYPALFLSKFQPVETIKGKQKIGRKNIFTRSLVIFQFAVSIVLLVSTGVIMQQLDFMKNKNLGFDSEQVLALPIGGGDGSHIFNILRDDLKQYDNILNIAGSNAYPGGGYNGTVVETMDARHSVNIAKVDYNFLDLFDMKLKEGRNFSEEITSDARHSVIINETLLKDLGWDSAIGKKLSMNWGGLSDVNVIGVVENFHFTSLHEEIEPLVFYVNLEVDIEYIFIKIKPENISSTIAFIQDTWQTVTRDDPFEYFFMKEEFEQLYQTEEQWNQMTRYSSLLAIVIACFGLFGLSALVITHRTKEIGIRKVLGSSVSGVVVVLSKEYILLTCIANIFAWPIAYYAMTTWLQNYAYRVNIGWGVFVLAGMIALVIAILTVSFQAVRAASANPVEALRCE